MRSRHDERRLRRHLHRRLTAAVFGGRPDRPGPAPRGPVALGAGALLAIVAVGVVGSIHAASGPSRVRAGRVPASVDAGRPVAASPSTSPSPSARPSSSPGAPAWQSGDVVIVDAGSGTRYLFRDGRLRPLANTLSAQLLLGTPHPATVRVPHATLTRVPTGPVLGITGAPDRIPAADHVLGGAWAACSVDSRTSVVLSGSGRVDGSGLTGFGSAAHGGADLASGAVIVVNAGVDYLVTAGHRARIPDPATLPGARTVTPVPIAATALGLLAPAPAVTATTTLPHLAPVPPGGSICVVTSAAGKPAGIAVGVAASGDRLTVPAARAVLARPAGASVISLLTDDGKRYPVSGAGALASLGYASAPVITMPAAVLDLIPSGPTLSAEAAGGP